MAVASKPPLEELLQDTPRAKLQLPCSDKDLCTLALSIPDWKELLPFLNLKELEKIAIEEEYNSVKRRKVALLRKWRAKYNKKATYESLSEALWKIGRVDLVEEVCSLLTNEAESSAEEEGPEECIGGSVPWREMSKLPCKDEHLCELALCIADWKELTPFLGLREVDEKMIEEDHGSSTQRRIATLRLWKNKDGSKATYGRLSRALRKIGSSDLVQSLYQIYTTSASETAQELSTRELQQTACKFPTTWIPCADDNHTPSDRDLCAYSACGDDIPSSVPLIAFIPPEHFEDVEKMFHKLLLSGRPECINEKVEKLVQCKDMDPSIRVLALGFQALEHTHSENNLKYALCLLEEAMKVIGTEMKDSNNLVIMEARIHRHYTIAYRKKGNLERALHHIRCAKKLYLTAQAPPYDYANLLCEHAAILETIHKEDTSSGVKELIGKLWEDGAKHIVLSKDYQFPTVVYVICARQAMFHMKAWSGKPQSQVARPNPQDLRYAEMCLQRCAEIKTNQHQPSAYKVAFNVAYSFLRFWQGHTTEALAFTNSAMSHYKVCQRKSERTAAMLHERLRWLQSLIPVQVSQSVKDVLVEILH